MVSGLKLQKLNDNIKEIWIILKRYLRNRVNISLLNPNNKKK